MYATSIRNRSTSSRKPATDKQIGFLRSLLNSKEHKYTPETLDLDILSKGQASQIIDLLVKAPRAKREPRKATVKADAPVMPEPGFYKVGDDIFKVQPARHGDRCYAKRLAVTVENGTFANVSWEYDRGAMYRIARNGRELSLEEAKGFGRTHGFCCACARLLTDSASVEAGIGPVCAKKWEV